MSITDDLTAAAETPGLPAADRAQLKLAAVDVDRRSTFVIDGFAFDLTLAWVDMIGGEWLWTGARTADDEPVMMSGADTVAPLPDVYRYYGPLIEVRSRTAADYRGALRAPTPADLGGAA
ncbi:phiSA1p31-related protein [Streptomyces syringium]|uniref:phiSA1p31-related protein n=1 Tax=Streptomyces syringium TaxID=76729 RepID=UPI003AAB744F